MTLGLAVTFENFQNFTCFSIFFDLKQLNRNKLWYPPNCTSFTLFNCSSLSCIILALSSAVTNLPNKTLISHDFQGRKIKFHDFPGFPWSVRTLFHLVIRERLSIARPCFNTIYFWNETWNDLLFCIAQLTQHFYNSTCASPTLLHAGCPKSSFLHFKSLYFSTIGLGKEITSTKVVSFNIIH